MPARLEQRRCSRDSGSYSNSTMRTSRVAHELDRAAAEVAALLGQPEVGEVDDRLRHRGEDLRRAVRGWNASGAPSRRTRDAPVPARGKRQRHVVPAGAWPPTVRAGRWSGRAVGVQARVAGIDARGHQDLVGARLAGAVVELAALGPAGAGVGRGARRVERGVVAGLGHQPDDLVPVGRGPLADDPAASPSTNTKYGEPGTS